MLNTRQRLLLKRIGQLSALGFLSLVTTVVVVVVWQHQMAVREVKGFLARGAWQENGRVLSAPLEVWSGMHITQEELAEDLQAAGYARVDALHEPGDFVVEGDALRLLRPAAEGPGWKLSPEEVKVTFGGSRIAGVSPDATVRFAPVVLASLRGAENEIRSPVSLDEMPPYLIQAVLAMEDARFFDHEGVDPIGITRAVVTNVTAGRIAQGGSTLTQQLVKNIFLSQERTVQRKAREVLLATALESVRSKREILELYLNEIYLGQVGGAAVAGVDEAARAYFGKPAERLSVAESATIAGIIAAPNRYSPLRHPEEAIQRRNLALDRMVEAGWMDPAQAAELRLEPLELTPTSLARRSPWVVDAAVDQVETALGEEGTVAARGLELHTTIQPGLQRIAERVVAESLDQLEKGYPHTEGAQMALVALRVSDGAVLAMVGGRDYDESQFNRALMAKRQVGSTVKPFTYLFALEANPSLSPGSVVQDEPIVWNTGRNAWRPENYDGRFKGEMTLRRALAESRNVPAVRVAEWVSMGRLKAHWRELGLSGASSLPSAALGSFEATPIEVAGAYTVFPSGGQLAIPYYVQSIHAPDGRELQRTRPEIRRIVSPQTAWMVTDMLRDVVRSGTAQAAESMGIVGPAAGKTGTTDENRDAWFSGFSKNIVVVVWVGFDQGRNLGLTGGQAALPAWARFMRESNIRFSEIPQPEGLELVTLCASTGRPVDEFCAGSCGSTYTDWFVEGQAPEPWCPEPQIQALWPEEEALEEGEMANNEPERDERPAVRGPRIPRAPRLPPGEWSYR